MDAGGVAPSQALKQFQGTRAGVDGSSNSAVSERYQPRHDSPS
jgi:hypothetical protein